MGSIYPKERTGNGYAFQFSDAGPQDPLRPVRHTPAQRFCQMSPGGWRHFGPPGTERPGNLLHFCIHRMRPAFTALVAFVFACARHTFAARSAERGLSQDVPGRDDKADLLLVDAPLLVTPDSDDHIARDQRPYDIPEILRGFVCHAADFRTAVPDAKRRRGPRSRFPGGRLPCHVPGTRALRAGSCTSREEVGIGSLVRHPDLFNSRFF